MNQVKSLDVVLISLSFPPDDGKTLMSLTCTLSVLLPSSFNAFPFYQIKKEKSEEPNGLNIQYC